MKEETLEKLEKEATTARRESHKELINDLTLESDPTKVWRIISAINQERPPSCQCVVEEELPVKPGCPQPKKKNNNKEQNESNKQGDLDKQSNAPQKEMHGNESKPEQQQGKHNERRKKRTKQTTDTSERVWKKVSTTHKQKAEAFGRTCGRMLRKPKRSKSKEGRKTYKDTTKRTKNCLNNKLDKQEASPLQQKN